MTIKELHNTLNAKTSISIIWDGYVHELNRDDELCLNAYGDFLIKEIKTTAQNHVVEITLKTNFARAE